MKWEDNKYKKMSVKNCWEFGMKDIVGFNLSKKLIYFF